MRHQESKEQVFCAAGATKTPVSDEHTISLKKIIMKLLCHKKVMSRNEINLKVGSLNENIGFALMQLAGEGKISLTGDVVKLRLN